MPSVKTFIGKELSSVAPKIVEYKSVPSGAYFKRKTSSFQEDVPVYFEPSVVGKSADSVLPVMMILPSLLIFNLYIYLFIFKFLYN